LPTITQPGALQLLLPLHVAKPKPKKQPQCRCQSLNLKYAAARTWGAPVQAHETLAPRSRDVELISQALPQSDDPCTRASQVNNHYTHSHGAEIASNNLDFITLQKWYNDIR